MHVKNSRRLLLCTSVCVCVCVCVSTCAGPVVGALVWRAVDEVSQAGDSVGAHQGVAPERTAVHHTDVEGRVEQLVLRQVLVSGVRGEG